MIPHRIARRRRAGDLCRCDFLLISLVSPPMSVCLPKRRQATRSISGRKLAVSLPALGRWISYTPWYDLAQRVLRRRAPFICARCGRGQVLRRLKARKSIMIYDDRAQSSRFGGRLSDGYLVTAYSASTTKSDRSLLTFAVGEIARAAKIQTYDRALF